jgi:hypothetical protein
VRDIETLDSEMRLVAVLRRAARERGGPLPSIHVADALLDEGRGLAELWNQGVLVDPVQIKKNFLLTGQ